MSAENVAWPGRKTLPEQWAEEDDTVRPAYLVLADGLAHLYGGRGFVGRRWDADASYLLTLLAEAGYPWPSARNDGLGEAE